jgi:hypothetical protein
MAQYSDHLAQAVHNLKFLGAINQHCNAAIDWQVTTNFYVGVHLVNSFLAREADLHFNSHNRVKESIAPNSHLATTRLDEPTYLAYVKLRNLSRRSRYLCGDDPNQESERAHFIAEKHFTKSFIHVDKLLSYFNSKYNDAYPVTSISYQFKAPTPNCKFFKFLTVQLPKPAMPEGPMKTAVGE